MEKNQIPVDQILQDLGIDPKSCQKQPIVDFAVSYAQKFVRKCIEMKQGLSTTKKIRIDDVRQTYESMKMIRSPQLSQKIQEKKKAIIQNTKKIMLDDQVASKANTVKLHLNNNLQHMMTNKQYQITFQ